MRRSTALANSSCKGGRGATDGTSVKNGGLIVVEICTCRFFVMLILGHFGIFSGCTLYFHKTSPFMIFAQNFCQFLLSYYKIYFKFVNSRAAGYDWLMLYTRADLELIENELLAPYAVRSSQSRGRNFLEDDDQWRMPFQKDRDRVIHSKAFRRLQAKTQVFVTPRGDHFRNRLTHSLEVAQIARDIARQFALNEDLSETIALAHDIGHPPFGHAGEDALDALLQPLGYNFEHNEHGKRIVEEFEEVSSAFRGLNLSFEVREGMMKHSTPWDHPRSVTPHAPSLEAQIVNKADEIGYHCHDVDDGLRARLITHEELLKLPLWQHAYARVTWKYGKALPRRIVRSRCVSQLMNLLIEDLMQESHLRLEKYGVRNGSDVQRMLTPLIDFSTGMVASLAELRVFLRERVYLNPTVVENTNHGKKVIEILFTTLMAQPELLPEKFTARLSDEYVLACAVRDYIAGMTDQFAVKLAHRFRKLTNS